MVFCPTMEAIATALGVEVTKVQASTIQERVVITSFIKASNMSNSDLQHNSILYIEISKTKESSRTSHNLLDNLRNT